MARTTLRIGRVKKDGQSMRRKGIILAGGSGGSGGRPSPAALDTRKQLPQEYDKSMMDYSRSTPMLAGIPPLSSSGRNGTRPTSPDFWVMVVSGAST